MNWNKWSRAEKIEHLFDYSYDERADKVEELWGIEATEYDGHICFPCQTPWEEIMAVLKKTGKEQHAYVILDRSCFGDIICEHTVSRDPEVKALYKWYRRVTRSKRAILLGFELYDESTLVSRVCTEEGDWGDEDGFGVKPDLWASALFDFEGKIVRPFCPGYLSNDN